jgi:hypothetical protein
MLKPRFGTRTVYALVVVIALLAGGGIATAKATIDVINAIDASALNAFQHQVEEQMADGDDNHRLVLGTVPADKRLVIEYISFRASPPAGEEVTLLVLTTTGGGEGAVHFLPLEQQPSSTLNVWTSNQLTRIYVDPGTTFTARVRRSSPAGVTFVDLTVSGHYVDK